MSGLWLGPGFTPQLQGEEEGGEIMYPPSVLGPQPLWCGAY